MRCYGEDEFRERGKVTGGEQTRGKKDDGGGCSYLLKEKARPASPAPERGRHGDKDVSPCEEAVKMIGGGGSVASRRWRSAVN